MSTPNWPQPCFSVNFTWLFLFPANFNCLFLHHQFHCTFPTSHEPPTSTRTNTSHFACIKTRIQNMLSFWTPTPMQISVWFIGATWNIFLLCGYIFSADLPMVIYIFLTKGTVLVQQALVKICQSSTILSKYWLSTMYQALLWRFSSYKIKSLAFVALIF